MVVAVVIVYARTFNRPSIHVVNDQRGKSYYLLGIQNTAKSITGGAITVIGWASAFLVFMSKEVLIDYHWS